MPQIQLAISYAPVFNPDAVPITLSNLVFERASLLFNLAALYSQLAAAEDRSTSDGIKRAAASYQVQSPPCASPVFDNSTVFQQAAGTLSFMFSSVIPKLVYPPDEVETPTDLSKDFIKCLEWLMLAQAQECSWQLAKLSV